MSIVTRREANVGFVEINNAPVNAIGLSVRKGLLDAVRWAEKERLERVIVSGSGRIFAAGADANEFDEPPVEPHLPDVVHAIETSFVPWIAAINGIALGGGAEIALACRMRIMSEATQIGFPEVNLGVIPGAGGTQRLPRLVGLKNALEMISIGKPISSDHALAIKLVHAVESDPVDAAFMVNSEELLCRVPTWELPAPPLEETIIESARALVTRKHRGQTARLRAIDTITAGLASEFDQAMALERTAFLELRGSEQSRSLRHIFFAEREALKPKWLNKKHATEIDRVAVIGGGTMGSGIAYALLDAGIPVTIIESDKDGADRATANVDKILSASLHSKHIDSAQAELTRQRLTVSTDYATVSDASLAIEATFEDMDVKKTVLSRLNAALSPDATIATNTSYLDVNELANAVTNPGRVIGLHFFAPAHVMKLLEIVRGDKTDDSRIAVAYQLSKKCRKIPVVSGVCDGFIGNRILARYREAADTVLMDGSTPADIDAAMVDFGYPMGPYEAQDLSGLDIAYANRRRQDANRDPNRRYIAIADKLVELGRLGRKTSAGWYRYSDEGKKVADPLVVDLVNKMALEAGIKRREYGAGEIQDRLLTAMINEAADILHEGIAQSRADIDLVSVYGYGFPRWRGGLLHYAGAIGEKNVVEKIEAFSKEDPVAWRVSPFLHAL